MTVHPVLSTRRLVPCLAAGLIFAAAFTPGAAAPQQAKSTKAPEVFRARATVGSAEGRGDAYVTMRVQQYTAQKDLDAMEKALREGGSAAFTLALKKAPVAGQLEVGSKTFTIRWARQKPNATGRVITLVVDAPVYFVGGGVPGAKSREGFDVAVVELTMDSSGVGEGRMAAAAKVKPGGDTGVEIDAYDAEPVKLRSVMRQIS